MKQELSVIPKRTHQSGVRKLNLKKQIHPIYKIKYLSVEHIVLLEVFLLTWEATAEQNLMG